jgi:hypothetical protein
MSIMKCNKKRLRYTGRPSLQEFVRACARVPQEAVARCRWYKTSYNQFVLV